MSPPKIALSQTTSLPGDCSTHPSVLIHDHQMSFYGIQTYIGPLCLADNSGSSSWVPLSHTYDKGLSYVSGRLSKLSMALLKMIVRLIRSLPSFECTVKSVEIVCCSLI